MDEQIFSLLAEKTAGFVFSAESGEPEGLSGDELHLFRLKALLTQVRQMGIRKFYQMPEDFRISQTMEDWMQDAMIFLCRLTDDYDPKKGPFNNYARFIVSRRLTDIQRKMFRKNPPLEEDLRKLAQSLRRETGKEPDVRELADLSGRSESEIRKFLEGGVGERVFVREHEGQERPEVRAGISPEEQYIRAECRKILLDCIEKLDADFKMLFMHREFEGYSFRELYDAPENREILDSHSEKTFQRRYKDQVYDAVQDCVEARY
ncbi:MAG: sigma-70 family RNA polymerase sigma factor [Desulfococcaceae bacterium]|jgi:RNA polymerase sigma factor (sigma-70 family)|nr:sigma-70 family RNA polymerase sigma factor [Desulfococcaceae bacterium]